MKKDAEILFSPFHMGSLRLKNRMVMAPLTRNRATHDNDVPSKQSVEYYAQRATAGLIISEATQISPVGKGYAWTPGIYSAEQIAGWKKVTEAVHTKGGLIFAQLWHVGRISHPTLQPHGGLPVAPSAVIPSGLKTFIETGMFTEISTPRELRSEEIPLIVADYRQAACNAMEAGFDGVEIHAANGYLIQQFLSDSSNLRQDAYGGSLKNRMRFALEVTEAVISAIGNDRTGIRLSPVTSSNGIKDSSPKETYFSLVRELDRMNIAYIHVIEGTAGGSRESPDFDFHALRKAFKGAFMVNNGYNRELAVDALASHYADLIAFGKLFIANPDLVERFRQDAPLNPLDPATLYGGTEKGYTDYPFL